CWFVGLVDQPLQHAIVVRRDLNPSYVDPSLVEHLFFHDAAAQSSLVDVGTFAGGPGLDFTLTYYDNLLHADVTKDGALLTHRVVDGTQLPADAELAVVAYCSAYITIEEVLTGPPLGDTQCAGQPDGSWCSDGNLCNGGESCQGEQ